MTRVDVIRVYGGTRLAGEVPVAGAKNSALKLMAAALLAPGRTTITNAPGITDISIMAEVLRRLGCQVEVDGGDITIDTPEELSPEADYNLVRRLRASICVLGPLLARCRHARVAHPGGDAIGSRGLDMHVAGLSRMGADIGSEHGFVVARAAQLTGAQIWLDFPSVGATENILMAAVLARGTTVIDNAAREPEIVDLADMLNSMGAQVSGAGTATLEVTGVESMHPTTHRTVGDRIVAGTWAFGAVMTRGDVTVQGVRAANLSVALDKLTDAGAAIAELPDTDGVPAFRVTIDRRPTAVDVVTLPYPGFATDLLPMAIGLGAVSGGVSLITENIFDGRFMFVNEMSRLGADIRTDGHHAVVRGRERLSGAPVRASDIRAGAGLAIAGLCAEGTTEVSHVHHIDRGYPHFVEQLRALGVKAERCTVPDDDFGY
ncbi:UDP-N-acetylglucosamine 1-carboxyvinyltransferase [Actinocatenispora sera]|uniref:UDP-N-acetylglucosamine 1-carboxyvinyltransferase n=1 Tax=Actinocatenispora sera TaxID=390989 RepID=UPI0004C3B7BF|nr:UDP-N-acetylglucosamine 1-carboxyvinyltransferase [Actinocatenispora sera]